MEDRREGKAQGSQYLLYRCRMLTLNIPTHIRGTFFTFLTHPHTFSPRRAHSCSEHATRRTTPRSEARFERNALFRSDRRRETRYDGLALVTRSVIHTVYTLVTLATKMRYTLGIHAGQPLWRVIHTVYTLTMCSSLWDSKLCTPWVGLRLSTVRCLCMLLCAIDICW
jgi:hypothetical protein